MIFAVSPQQTTLYDEIEYQGSPSSFAWVLPIHATVTVALSSDILFQALDQATTTTIVAPTLPACPTCGCATPNEGFAAGSSGSSSSGGASVNVLEQQVVGPYDTVQLSATDPTALTAWLSANGYSIPTNVVPIIGEYVKEGFNFLAMRLAPGQGVQAMRPVSVTSAGAGLTLPLRMVAAGTGATVGITLWVVASGRYEPMNFQTFTISGSDLTWDWSANDSNYATVQANKEAALGNAAWQIESSLSLSPFQIENVVLADPADVDYLSVPAGGQDADAGADAEADGGGLTGPAETADEVRQQDLATCFPGSDATEVQITRMRADLSQAALANDLVLQASADQSQLSNIYQVTMSVNEPACPVIDASNCACGPTGSSGGGSGTTGSGTTTTASPGQQSFGCSASPTESSGEGLELGLAGLVGVALVRARFRRKR
jgi:MYXO-CTERM domain-containing protein